MRLGVLDIGSNTGHLLVVDAHGGAAPLPAYSFKEPLRLAEHLDDDGAMTDDGHRRAGRLRRRGAAGRRGQGLRGDARLRHLRGPRRHQLRRGARRGPASDAGVDLEVLPGEDEARLTFLAVRRWFGWSSGRLMVFDIGGGSLEIAAGADEAPDVAQSLPLGAGRLTREWLTDGPADADAVRELRRKVRAEIAHDAGAVLRPGRADHAVATSKTFRSLARICGAAPSGGGPARPPGARRATSCAEQAAGAAWR